MHTWPEVCTPRGVCRAGRWGHTAGGVCHTPARGTHSGGVIAHVVRVIARLEQDLHGRQSQKVVAKLEGRWHTWQELLPGRGCCTAGAGLARLAGTLQRRDVGHTPGKGCRTPSQRVARLTVAVAHRAGAWPSWQVVSYPVGAVPHWEEAVAPPGEKSRGRGGLGAGGGAGPSLRPSSLAAPPRPVPAPWRARAVPAVPRTPGMC